MVDWIAESRLAGRVPAWRSGDTSRHAYVPFAFWSIEAFRPRRFVELGTRGGDSYCSFCQAVDDLALDTRCSAVDTWTTGPHGEKVYRDLRRHHDRRYARFSRLIRSTFDEARGRFPDGSIDLLHIDGSRAYEAVRHDFEAWLPAMSRAGVILLHDVASREKDLGIWRLWDELRERYPSFTFRRGGGLGVLVVGPEAPEPARRLAACDEREAEEVRALFERLGQAVAERRAGASRKQERNAASRPISVVVVAGARAFRLAGGAVRERFRRVKYARLIRGSGLFDTAFYLSQCPEDPEARRDPIRHYLLRGAAAGLDPNPFFDTSYYLERYPDVAAGGKNPLVHFVRHGASERRTPSARFDTAYYLARHRDVLAAGMNPLAHYLTVGAAEGRPCRPRQREVRSALGDVLDRAGEFADPRRARRILVVNRRSPTPDRDPGTARVLALLTQLRRLGREIVFVSDGADPAEPPERALQQLGIEVLCGFPEAVAHLAVRGHEYRVVLLAGPQIAERYLAVVRAHALRAKVIYDAGDVASVTGDSHAREDAGRNRLLEQLATTCADVTLSGTEHGRELLLAAVPEARIEVAPDGEAIVDRLAAMFSETSGAGLDPGRQGSRP